MASLWPGANLRATGVKSAGDAPADPTPVDASADPAPTTAPMRGPATWFQGTDIGTRYPVLPSIDRRQIDPNVIWRTQPSVRKVVEWRCRLLASITYRLYERGPDGYAQPVTDHPIARLLDRPSRRRDNYDFFFNLAVDHHMFDQAVAVVARGEDGYELRLLPPTTTRIEYEFREPAAITTAARNGERVDIDPALAVILTGYIDSAGRPTPRVETMADLLAEMTAATEYREALFKNAARVPAVLERPLAAPKWSDSARDRFAASWQAFTRGGGKEGGTPILEDGMTLAKVEAFKPIDTGDLDARKLSDAQAASVFQTPPELVGAAPGNFSSIDAWRQTIYGPVLGPDIVATEQALTSTLVPLLGGGRDFYIAGDVDTKMRGSFLEQAAAMSTAVGAPWLTRDEARAMENRPSIDGGDQLVTPLNVLIGGLASPRDTAPKR